jgi:rhodanese-related sulfurtransferase
MIPQPIPQVPTVHLEDVARLQTSSALLIDVREQTEWDHALIPGFELRPMSTINDWYLDVLGHQVGDTRLMGGRRPRELWLRR